MRDLTILMSLTPGVPAALLERAAAKGVPISAGCLFPRLGGRVAHVLVEDPDVEVIKQVVSEFDATVADDRECIVVPSDYPGGAAAAARKVADAGGMVNVSYFGAEGQIVLATADIAGARRALDL